MIYTCCDARRRAVLAGQTAINAIDFLDVVNDPSMPAAQRQRTLNVHFLHPLTPDQIKPANIVISGGERITGIKVVSATVASELSPGGNPRILVVVVNTAGDFSPYQLQLVQPNDPTEPPAGFDPVLSAIEFSFKAACPNTLDCQPESACSPSAVAPPAISYLAKDYTSFRTLLLDRMATVIPAWTERHPADVGVMLVELLAYLGDNLSYQQDATYTESYLQTARRRTSVRRHVRLVDYPMSDGCNARTWIHFETGDGIAGVTVPAGTELLTAGSSPTTVLDVASQEYKQALAENPVIFETMEPVTVRTAHNRLPLYTWGDRECCLPAGSTGADLEGAYPDLQIGDVLLLVEEKGPLTGATADADPSHRYPVRLTAITQRIDPIGGQFDDPQTNAPTIVTHVDWGRDDALPAPLCVTNTVGGTFLSGISAAWGNIALADHGFTVRGEALPPVPAANPALTVQAPPADWCGTDSTAIVRPVRYNPTLAQSPLTFADPYSPASTSAGVPSAAQALQRQESLITAQITSLTQTDGGRPWSVQPTLLRSVGSANNFVAEVEDDGSASLRFGDGTFGSAPTTGTSFQATYRVGNGTAGNVGAGTLVRLATDTGSVLLGAGVILSVTNPLAGMGGEDPETLDEVRLRAPQAFRAQERAVTPEDYGTMAVRVDPLLQRGTGTLRWTGSWQTVFVSVDPQDSETLNDSRRAAIANGLELYRMAGQDVDVQPPVYVSLELKLSVCVQQGYQSAHVEAALRNVLSNCSLPDGSRGLFHPDNFTFGQTVYLSPIYAAVQDTPGVASVTVKRFARQGKATTDAVSAGKLTLGRLEIARLANDPDYPEHGQFTLHMKGGS